MRLFIKLATVSAAISLFLQPASAGETAWFKTDGGNIRIITEPFMRDAREIRGVIDIDLLPGWKTYWRDPGAGGLPPQIDAADPSIIRSAEIHFPAPKWVKSSYGDYAGYKEPVEIPFTLDLSAPASETETQIRLMVGICADICIPAFSDFTIQFEEAKGSTRDASLVMNAFAALPLEPSKLGVSTHVKKLDAAGNYELTIDADVAPSELFASSKNGMQFKKPRLITGNTDQNTYLIEPLHVLDKDKKADLIITGKSPEGAFEFSAE